MNRTKETEKKHIRVACIGNPNCGKTTLFNALTGSRLKVANWPGVTVERVEGETSYEDTRITIVDTPVVRLLYTSPSPRDLSTSRMPSSA